MAEGRSRQLWDIGSEILAALYNGLLRAEGQSAFEADQFHPHRIRDKAGKVPKATDPQAESREGFAALKAAFGRREGSRG